MQLSQTALPNPAVRGTLRDKAAQRFTCRASAIRIIGAGYWRKGKAIYERENAA
jgi:hypothetical protein